MPLILQSSLKIFLIIFLLLFSTILATTINKIDDDQKKFYVVYLGNHIPDDETSANQAHIDVLSNLKGSESDARESIVHSYHRSFNAFAAKLSNDEAATLSEMDEVLWMFENKYHKLHTTRSWDFIRFPQSAKRKLKMESNIIVGLFDTGITPQSESFKDDGLGPPPAKWKGVCPHYANFSGCNNKIIGARYLKLDKVPDPSDILSPVDVEGHGTHTSSTLAGTLIPNANLSGLAAGTARGAVPSARIAAYKVCWASSGCSDIDILAAFDHAIADGVDLISISIGGPSPDYVSDSISIGSFHALKKGILTVGSAGNDGPSFGSVANHAPWMISVAASGIDRGFRSRVSLHDGQNVSGVGINLFDTEGKSYTLVSGEDVARNSENKENARYCVEDSMSPSKVKGKLVLCKLQNWGVDSVVKGTGGVGAIVSSPRFLDVAMIFMAPGTMPDIAAPGIDILASYTPLRSLTGLKGDTQHSKFTFMTGTSMACPHVAGVAAYVKSFHPKWSPAAIRSAIITTARPMSSRVNREAEFAYGAGQVNPLKAKNPGLVYDMDEMPYIQFLCREGYSGASMSVLVGSKSINCSTLLPAFGHDSLNYPTMQLNLKNKQKPSIAVFRRRVTNVGQAKSVYNAIVRAPKGVNITVKPTSLSFSRVLQTRSFKVVVKADPVSGAKILSGSLIWKSSRHIVRIAATKMVQTKMVYWLMLLILVAATTSASADRTTYIVHTDKSKIVELNAMNKQPREWYETILNSVKELRAENDYEEELLAPELLYTYETTMSGFAAKLTTKQYQSLNKINGVLFAAPDVMLNLHTTYSTHFLGLEFGRGLWNESSLATDVIVGVLDTGIWPEHISFSDKGLSQVPVKWKGTCEKGANFSASNCNKKLIGARAFLKGYEAINGRINGTDAYRSVRDSNGHGTHTASTAAGSMVHGASFSGMAKGVASGMRFTSRIAAYKVCWSRGCASSDILAAIDQAVADGVDVLSLSLGGIPRPYYQDSMAIASFGAIEKGVFFSCSAGNSGPISATVGNMAPWMMTVAASYTNRVFPTKVRLSNGKHFKGSSLYSGVKKTNQLPLVYKETAGGRRAEFCINGSLSSSLIKGKIVLCERGLTGRTAKSFVVRSAGGAGMILLNSPTQGEELFADPHVLPATTVGASAAKAIKEYYVLNKNITASISFYGTRYGGRAPVVAAFSSRGPSLVDPYVVKPDITAPGVNILAAWPPIIAPTEQKDDNRRVQFNIVSGTSMSCPHLSGIAALVKSVHKDWSPAAIKSAIMTSAYTHDNHLHLISDAYVSQSTKYATPFAFGSGHVNPERASDPGLVSVLARKKYSCPKPQKKGSNTLQPGDLNYPSFAVIFEAFKKGKTTFTYRRTVTNVGTPKISYRVFVDQPKKVEISVEPKVLAFKKLGEKLSYEVSFTGSGANITTRAANSLPV
ncbi:Subtilisin-like protease SBT4.14 [Bienertia sinuspersici]